MIRQSTIPIEGTIPKMENSSTVIDVAAMVAKVASMRRKPEHNPILTRGELYSFLRRVGPVHRDCGFGNYRTDVPGQRKFKATAIKYASNLDQMWEEGRGLLFYGSSGTGKDHMTMAVAKEAWKRGYWVSWINGPSFRSRVRECIREDESEGTIFRELVGGDFLWLSDPVIGGQSLTPFQLEFLYRVIDERNRHRRPTWVTANFHKGQEFSSMIGAAAYDRIRDRAVACYCDWETDRKVS